MKRIHFVILLLLVSGCAALSGSPQLSMSPLVTDSSDNLDGVLVKDSDLTFSVFREGVDGAIAGNHSRDLARAYRIVSEAIGVEPSDVSWAQVAFTRDSGYQPPRVQDVTRWVVPLERSGSLGSKGMWALYQLVPHEQVHSIQGLFGPLPRWYSEGMAEWAGLKATAVLAPSIEAERRAQHDQQLAAATRPLSLASWGGVQVKPEAFLRQLTPEQRRKKEADPNYSPPGPFSFTPEDFVSDESNTAARYAASLALFEAIEAEAGPEGMRTWIAEVAKLPDPKRTNDIARLAKEIAGVDISGMLVGQ